MRSGLAAIIILVFASGASAAEPYVGSWAAKASDCGSEPLFIFSVNNVVGATFACKRATYSKTAKGWNVAAKACSAEDSEAPSDMTFAIILAGDKLQVDWGDGTTSAKVVRCPKS